MHRQTRKNLLNMATGVAVAAAAVVVFLPAAYAAPGTVTSNVNVRSGPGTNYAVVDVARSGQQVDVQQCQGSWCYISKPGPDGWVSSTYLTAGGRPVNPSNPGLSFGFTVGGPNGPQISIGVGNQPQPQPPRPGPRPPVVQPVDEICFYDRARFRGDSFCMTPGESTRDLRSWTDRISSIDNPGGYEVQVCSEPNYRSCRTYTTSASSLGDFDDYIASIRTR
ncbi:Peptidase inhibitor family I36 [Devosia lucknowensis]|uniref:Peptidase inhibitor family I36 n=1 Tax=Devosia lucknowensis TaxID=1096929 RepID=A0A1Y6FAD5_9HYPH|nr:SH3 domain-containing protein [Devosia lucknowensis]SMQ70521.1 Peptidase inhibitor family I36 [Devosia lucknowensis]